MRKLLTERYQDLVVRVFREKMIYDSISQRLAKFMMFFPTILTVALFSALGKYLNVQRTNVIKVKRVKIANKKMWSSKVN